MKKLLLSAAILVPVALVAQPTITESQYTLTVGDVITSYSQTYAAPSEGASQTWDYTSFTTSSGATINIIDPASAGITGLPASTYCYEASGLHDCYLKNSAGVQRTGASSSGVNIPYDDSEVILNFPVTFNQSATDPFHAAFTYGTSNAIRRGTITNTVVGYGTLNLPNSVTINNAMLVKSHEVHTDSIYIVNMWQVIYSDYTNYNFYAANYKGAIVTMSSGTVSGNPGTSGIYNVTGVISGLEMYDISSQLTVFPNPAENMITVSNQGNFEVEGFEYKIVNMNGQVVKTGIFNSNTLEVSDLETGLYLLQINSDTFTATRKFLKK